MPNIDLRCGDALELFKEIKSSSVDVVIADPPYNLGKNYGNNHDLKGFDEYIDFTKSWLSEANSEANKGTKANRYAICFYGR